MARTMTYTEELTAVHCWCGIALAVPSNLYTHAHASGASIYCPLGHQFSWNETTADKLRKQLEQANAARDRAEQRRQAERDLREDTERRLAAQKGATTKAKKRAAAALCPCCNRSFVQMRRHLEAKHPGYDPAKVGA
jgi:hypothetical protein